MLDKSQGLVLGPDRVTNGGFDTDTDWSKGAGWTISGGVASKSLGVNSDLFQFAEIPQNTPLRITLTVTVVVGSVLVRIFGGSTPSITTTGEYDFFVVSGSSGSVSLAVNAASTFQGTIDNISVRELPGYHATQATAGSRPTLRQPATAFYLEDDGGDSLNWTAPAGTYTIVRVNSAGTVTTLTSQALSGATDMLLDAQTTGYLAINRALTDDELTKLTAYFEARAA
jgi:hypothetical protein